MTRLVPAVCAVLVLAGCAGNIGTGSSEKAPELPAVSAGGASAADDTTQPRVKTNERGFVVKKLGETACFGGAGKNCEGGVSFAIDKVDVDPTCTEFGSHPDNGHTLLLHLRIATGDDPAVVDRVGGVVNPFSFVEIGKDGVTREVSIGLCADPSTDQLPDTYGPNQKYAGVMDLEVPKASGTLALQLMGAEEDGLRGWEWTYPA